MSSKARRKSFLAPSLALCAIVAALAGCYARNADLPAERGPHGRGGSPERSARTGIAPPGTDASRLCSDWRGAVGRADGYASEHDASPELVDAACFVRVHHASNGAVSATRCAASRPA